MKKFKFLLITPTKFHYFEVAKALYKKNQLTKIISGYPWFKIKKENIPKKFVDFFGLYTIFYFLLLRFNSNFFHYVREIFIQLNINIISKKPKKYIHNSDIVLSLSGSLGKSIITLKKYKKIIICERASSHILFQKKILEEEYTQLNLIESRNKLIKYGFSNRIVENELIEYKHADHILVPSPFVSKTFKDYGIDHIIEMPFNINNSLFYRDHNIKKDKNAFNILFVGSLTIRKGLHYLIEAFNNFKHPNAFLNILGAGYDESYLKKLAFSNKRIIFYGNKKGHELRNFYNKADLFVLPSLEEGFAYVQLEALACGCPLLISENTGAKETVIKNKCGMVFPIRDSKEILSKLELLANDKKTLNKLSENALNYSFNNNWHNYVEVLNKKLNKIYGI